MRTLTIQMFIFTGKTAHFKLISPAIIVYYYLVMQFGSTHMAIQESLTHSSTAHINIGYIMSNNPGGFLISYHGNDHLLFNLPTYLIIINKQHLTRFIAPIASIIVAK